MVTQAAFFSRDGHYGRTESELTRKWAKSRNRITYASYVYLTGDEIDPSPGSPRLFELPAKKAIISPNNARKTNGQSNVRRVRMAYNHDRDRASPRAVFESLPRFRLDFFVLSMIIFSYFVTGSHVCQLLAPLWVWVGCSLQVVSCVMCGCCSAVLYCHICVV